MGKSTRKAVKKPVDMDRLREECQRFHAYTVGMLDDLNNRLCDIRSEMADKKSPLNDIWYSDSLHTLHNGVSDLLCDLCNLFVAIPPPAGSHFPDPLALCGDQE